MITYRPFLNTDPPHILDVWKRQPPLRGQVGSLTSDLLEQQVFSKPFFDRDGLWLAIDESNEQPQANGFVHAALGPNEALDDVDPAAGVICQLKTVDHEQRGSVAAQLLQHACDYLKQRGAREVRYGGWFPNAPFYHGLYGGSRVPGVLADDVATLNALKEAGFEQHDTISVCELSLTGFKGIVNRQQMMLRRTYVIRNDGDPLARTWWENCTLGGSNRDRFTVASKISPEECGWVSYWDMEPLASQWNVTARGLYDLSIAPQLQRAGLATFLVGESLRHLMQQGVTMVEAQARQSDGASLGVFKKLGFQEVRQGILMQKTLG